METAHGLSGRSSGAVHGSKWPIACLKRPHGRGRIMGTAQSVASCSDTCDGPESLAFTHRPLAEDGAVAVPHECVG